MLITFIFVFLFDLYNLIDLFILYLCVFYGLWF